MRPMNTQAGRDRVVAARVHDPDAVGAGLLVVGVDALADEQHIGGHIHIVSARGHAFGDESSAGERTSVSEHPAVDR